MYHFRCKKNLPRKKEARLGKFFDKIVTIDPDFQILSILDPEFR